MNEQIESILEIIQAQLVELDSNASETVYQMASGVLLVPNDIGTALATARVVANYLTIMQMIRESKTLTAIVATEATNHRGN